MNTATYIGSKFYDLLMHQDLKEEELGSGYSFTCEIKMYIPYHTFSKRGGFLSNANVKEFNSFVEAEIKNRFRQQMDFYLSIFPNFMENLPTVRKNIGIDIDSWDSDSMKKDYYRYRVRNNLPMLYGSNYEGFRSQKRKL